MMNLRYELNYYIELLAELKLELETLPEGSLVKIRNTYCHKINGKGTGISNDPEKIGKLARKKFIVVFIGCIEHNLDLMRKILASLPVANGTLNAKKFKSLHPKEIINSLPKTYQGLSETYFYHSFVSEWLATDPAANEYKKELRIYKSKSGRLFRSRAEQSFANLLEDNGLLYKSDVELMLGGIKKFPDFMVLNPFIGKLTILEFFGLANQSGYDKQMNSKMDWYRMNNLNVIYLFESDMRDSQHLQDLIDERIWKV